MTKKIFVHSERKRLTTVKAELLTYLEQVWNGKKGHWCASSSSGVFHRFFGRDGAVICDDLLDTYQFEKGPALRRLYFGRAQKHYSFEENYLGKAINSTTVEEPGKVPHEIKDTGEIWYTSVDATPLSITVFSRLLFLSGKEGKEELLARHEKSLRQKAKYLENARTEKGYLGYRYNGVMTNKFWRDSEDSLLLENGEKPSEPVFPVHVQGLNFSAGQSLVYIFSLLGDRKEVQKWQESNRRLKINFNQDFWMREENYFVLALYGEKLEKVKTLSSDPLAILRTGIITGEKVPAVVRGLKKLMTPWGIRTVCPESPLFRSEGPESYHRGSIWPHSNEDSADGLRKWGYDQKAKEVEDAILRAYAFFGSPRETFNFPKGACKPKPYKDSTGAGCTVQGWAISGLLKIVTMRQRMVELGINTYGNLVKSLQREKVVFLEPK